MKKMWILGIVVVVIIGNVILFAQLRRRAPVSSTPPAADYNAVVDARIDYQRGGLQIQSLEESLTMLSRMEPYAWPGARMLSGMYSTSDSDRYRYAFNQQGVVLSSRVFRKCLEEIRLIPREKAIQLIDEHLESALATYIDESEKLLAFHMQPTGNIPPSTTDCDGAQYKVLALVLIAGTCGFPENHAMVKKVADYASPHGQEMESNLSRWELSRKANSRQLWNPHVMSAGLYGTHPNKDWFEFKDQLEFCGLAEYNDFLEIMNFSDRFIECPMVDYMADRTEFDDSFGRDVVPDKDYITVCLFEDATDDDALILLGVSKQESPAAPR